MRKTASAAITAAALILAGIAAWAAPSNRALQVKPSTAMGAKIDTFGMMASAKNLPTEEFRDFSLVF
jgi:hypothetical protein